MIVKVFGTNTDTMIDRQAEIETMKVNCTVNGNLKKFDWKFESVFCGSLQILHERECGAELYATFDNGICYQFMNGITLEVENCQDPGIYSLVAAEMARMHSDIQTDYMMSGSPTETADIIGQGQFNNNHKRSHYYEHSHFSNQQKSQIWNKLRTFDKLAEDIMADDEEFKKRYVIL